MFLVFLGLIFYIVGAIGFLIAEFKESVLWGLFGPFTQIGNLIFAVVHYDKCKKSLGYMLLGIVLMILGVIWAG